MIQQRVGLNQQTWGLEATKVGTSPADDLPKKITIFQVGELIYFSQMNEE
jgi:hypothetical protein